MFSSTTITSPPDSAATSNTILYLIMTAISTLVSGAVALIMGLCKMPDACKWIKNLLQGSDNEANKHIRSAIAKKPDECTEDTYYEQLSRTPEAASSDTAYGTGSANRTREQMHISARDKDTT